MSRFLIPVQKVPLRARCDHAERRTSSAKCHCLKQSKEKKTGNTATDIYHNIMSRKMIFLVNCKRTGQKRNYSVKL
jgi:hypothetical protein